MIKYERNAGLYISAGCLSLCVLAYEYRDRTGQPN